MAGLRGNDYFAMLAAMGGCARRSARELQQIITDFDPTALEENMLDLHVIENEADEQKHEIIGALAKEFIAPIEREDILRLAGQLDDVVDGIEDILIKIYMYNIRSIIPEALEFLDVISHCCDELMAMLEEFANFRKSKTIHASIVELNRLEEKGDRLYMQAMRKLYLCGEENPVRILAWSNVLGRMEHCCDACENTANLVEEVMMKNS